ncbi:MAG: ROK family protein, partial [Planctomycetales bacterium]
ECWVGFDLGSTKMLATVFDADFRPLGRRRRKTRGHEGVDVGLKRIARTIREALDEAGVVPGQVSGIGLGCPGPIDPDRGVILDTPNLGWKDVPIRDLVRDEFGCDVVVINDVDAGLFGEYRFGAARGARCAVGIFPGTGIGGGCVYEGRILQGRGVTCMEIGHTYLAPPGGLSGVGRKGTLESVAGRLAIAAAAAQAAYRGEAPRLMQEAGTDLANVRSSVLAASIAAGDKAVERIVREAAEHIGTAVANVVHLLAPEIVVLGGGLIEALPELFVEVAGQTARRRVLPPYVDAFRVVAAELGDDAAVLGAAAWAREVASDELRVTSDE